MTAAPPPRSLPDMPARRAVPFLTLVALLLFVPGLFSLPPVDRDESRYAQASRQMLETGNFIDIRFQDRPRHKKPIGIYWLQSASTALLGDGASPQIWTYRVPSVAGAVAAVLLTWLAASRLFGRPTGLAAALILSGTLILGFEARQAKTDAVLLATVIGAQTALAAVYMKWRAGDPVPPWIAYAFWLAVGLGVLVKGPIVVLVSAGTVLVLGFWDRAWPMIRALRLASGLCLALALVLPWFVAIALESDGAFFRQSVGHDLLGKVLSGQESHGAPPGYYLGTFWITFWPFALPAALAVPWAWRNRSEPGVRFCIAWIVPAWVVFELVATKLPHYVLPVFPALAILAAAALGDSRAAASPRKTVSGWIALSLSLAGTAALAAAVIGFPLHAGGTPSAWTVVAAAGLLLAAVATVRLFLAPQRAGVLIPVLLVAALATGGAAYRGILPGVEALMLSPRLADVLRGHRVSCPGAALVTSGYTEPSLVFLAGTETRLDSPEGAAGALAMDPSCAIVSIDARDEKNFRTAAVAAGVRPRLIAELPGFNYSRGSEVVLRVFVGR